MATETITPTATSSSLALQANHAPKPRDVVTTLNYYKDPSDGSPPMPVYVEGGTVTNERPTTPMQVTVHDITGEESKYTLDGHGFQLVTHKSKEKAFDDEERIKTEYYAECEELYKRITGASSVHIFGHLVRSGPTHWHTLGAGNASKKGPLHRVHIDQSYSGAELILRKHIPDRTDSILTSNLRWQITNLWRPIRTILKDPLAVAAAHSIAETDLVEAKVIYTKQPPPFNESRTWTVLPREGHEWYYKNEMGREEVLAIKCFDSKEGQGLARRAPHCAFRDLEREGEGLADRESVEVRAVLVYDE